MTLAFIPLLQGGFYLSPEQDLQSRPVVFLKTVNCCSSFFRSSIFKKWIVALTGLVLLGFVIGHLVGNLQIFSGPEKINVYAVFLKDLGALLWVIRGFLFVCFVLHIVTTIQLVIENRKARPEKYEFKNRVQSRLSTRLMAVSGLIILCFVIFHILHFTTHNVDPTYGTWHDATGRHDVYRMMIAGFSNKAASAFYIVGMLLLCSHLSHGIGSVFQTLGLRTQKSAPLIGGISRTLALLIAVGYISMPVAVMMGLGREYVQEREQIVLKKGDK